MVSSLSPAKAKVVKKGPRDSATDRDRDRETDRGMSKTKKDKSSDSKRIADRKPVEKQVYTERDKESEDTDAADAMLMSSIQVFVSRVFNLKFAYWYSNLFTSLGLVEEKVLLSKRGCPRRQVLPDTAAYILSPLLPPRLHTISSTAS